MFHRGFLHSFGFSLAASNSSYWLSQCCRADFSNNQQSCHVAFIFLRRSQQCLTLLKISSGILHIFLKSSYVCGYWCRHSFYALYIHCMPTSLPFLLDNWSLIVKVVFIGNVYKSLSLTNGKWQSFLLGCVLIVLLSIQWECMCFLVEKTWWDSITVQCFQCFELCERIDRKKTAFQECPQQQHCAVSVTFSHNIHGQLAFIQSKVKCAIKHNRIKTFLSWAKHNRAISVGVTL